MRILFSHAHLVIDGNKEYLDGALLVNDDIIEEVFVNSIFKYDLGEYQEINCEGKIIMPGFFDTHIHGSKGVHFSYANEEELNNASYSLAFHGTTSFLTSLTNNENLINELNILENTETDHSRFLGIHLEGPFISQESKGALNGEYILNTNIDKLNEILSSSTKIRQMTIAPELEGSEKTIDILHKNNIKVMFGHSLATKKDVKDKEYDGYTHLFNGMSGFKHRDLGLVNIAFLDDKYKELICDGNHVDKDVLKVAVRNIKRDKLVMISDSTMMAGVEDGPCIFEGEKCNKIGSILIREKDGRIAAACDYLIDEVKLMYELGSSLTDILLMTSLNAYKLYGLDKRFGSLVKGKYADIVILDDKLNLINTYVRGKLINA